MESDVVSVEVFETSAEIHPVPPDARSSPIKTKKILVKRAKSFGNNSRKDSTDQSNVSEHHAEKNHQNYSVCSEPKPVIIPTLTFDCDQRWLSEQLINENCPILLTPLKTYFETPPFLRNSGFI